MNKIFRVCCPKCGTSIVHQIKEEANDEKCTVTYYCGGCKKEFTKDYAIGNYSKSECDSWACTCHV